MNLRYIAVLLIIISLLYINSCSSDLTNPVGPYITSNYNPYIQPDVEACTEMTKVYYEGGPYKDEGGDYYNTVQIGKQCWLKENLNIGEMIYASRNMTENSVIEKYCYNNNKLNCDAYGGLYQWYEAMHYVTDDEQGICPEGWHIPGSHEFQILSDFVNGEYAKLVAVGQPATAFNPTNESGFSALIAGTCDFRSQKFNYLGCVTAFWSSTGNESAAVYLKLSKDIEIWEDSDRYGFSLRCIKN